MPDWSYQTVLKPLLFALPPRTARDFSLGLMGTLARLPLGSAVIDFLGHLRPPKTLGRRHLGLTFPSPVGLGSGLDPEGRGTAALERFGVGFIEVGPITLRPAKPRALSVAILLASPSARRSGPGRWSRGDGSPVGAQTTGGRTDHRAPRRRTGK